jgi:hypothetical protein
MLWVQKSLFLFGQSMGSRLREWKKFVKNNFSSRKLKSRLFRDNKTNDDGTHTQPWTQTKN